ncbi:hypothetical protein MTO96_020759 [Rhipicephalus appendiculatus]
MVSPRAPSVGWDGRGACGAGRPRARPPRRSRIITDMRALLAALRSGVWCGGKVLAPPREQHRSARTTVEASRSQRGKQYYILHGRVVVKGALLLAAHRDGHRGGAHPFVSEVRYAAVAVYSHRVHVAAAAAAEEAVEEKAETRLPPPELSHVSVERALRARLLPSFFLRYLAPRLLRMLARWLAAAVVV